MQLCSPSHLLQSRPTVPPHSPKRSALLWQLGGGLIAAAFVLACIGEMLWWSLFLSDRTNVSAKWTIVTHSFAAVAVAALIWYMRKRRVREAAFASASPADAERAAFRFRLGPFAVHVSWDFLFMALVLGLIRGDDLLRAAVFLPMVAAAVIAHEVGHAAAATRMGFGHIRISLHALGGDTTYLGWATRAQKLAIAFAGPAVGLFLAAIVWSAVPESWVRDDLLLVTLGWSLINLMPLQPLDGGEIVEALLRGRFDLRVFSTIFAILGAIVAMLVKREGFVLFFVVLAIMNTLAIPAVMAKIERLKARFG